MIKIPRIFLTFRNSRWNDLIKRKLQENFVRNNVSEKFY